MTASARRELDRFGYCQTTADVRVSGGVQHSIPAGPALSNIASVLNDRVLDARGADYDRVQKANPRSTERSAPESVAIDETVNWIEIHHTAVRCGWTREEFPYRAFRGNRDIESACKSVMFK